MKMISWMMMMMRTTKMMMKMTVTLASRQLNGRSHASPSLMSLSHDTILPYLMGYSHNSLFIDQISIFIVIPHLWDELYRTQIYNFVENTSSNKKFNCISNLRVSQKELESTWQNDECLGAKFVAICLIQ